MFLEGGRKNRWGRGLYLAVLTVHWLLTSKRFPKWCKSVDFFSFVRFLGIRDCGTWWTFHSLFSFVQFDGFNPNGWYFDVVNPVGVTFWCCQSSEMTFWHCQSNWMTFDDVWGPRSPWYIAAVAYYQKSEMTTIKDVNVENIWSQILLNIANNVICHTWPRFFRSMKNRNPFHDICQIWSQLLSSFSSAFLFLSFHCCSLPSILVLCKKIMVLIFQRTRKIKLNIRELCHISTKKKKKEERKQAPKKTHRGIRVISKILSCGIPNVDFASPKNNQSEINWRKTAHRNDQSKIWLSYWWIIGR